MNESYVLSAGYFVTRPRERYEGLSDPDLVPPRLFSASDCFGWLMPASWCYGWTADPLSSDTYEAAAEWSIPPERVPRLIELVGSSSTALYPFAVCRTLGAARRLLEAMGSSATDLCLIGIALPRRVVDAFHEASAPPPQEPGCSPFARNAFSTLLMAGTPPADGGDVLGFEPVEYYPGTSSLGCSWVCGHLTREVCDALSIRTNRHGLLDDIEDACRASAHVSALAAEGKAEPGPWFPWQIVRYA